MSDEESTNLSGVGTSVSPKPTSKTHITLIVTLRRLPNKRRITELERALAHYYEKSCRLEYPDRLAIKDGTVEVVGTPKGR